MVNLSSENSVIRDGRRICQMVIAQLEREEWIMVDNLVDTDKGLVGLDIQVKNNYEII